MKRALPVALVMLLAGAVLPGDASTAVASVATKVKRNASLSLQTVVPVQQLDPHLETGSAARAYFFPIYDRLVYLDKNVAVKPMLATKWVFSPDGRTLTLTLRKDAVFHDGSPVDANAVQFSLERAKTLPRSTAASSLSSIDSVTAVDASTVRVTLNRAAGDLLSELGGLAGVVMNPKVAGMDLGQGKPDAAGSGPWVVGEFKANNVVRYTRAPTKYWDPGAGLLKQVAIHYILDPNEALDAVTSGRVDGGLVRATNFEAARQLAGHRFYRYDTTTNLKLMYDVTKPPFDKVQVRQAIATAMDREALGDRLLRGTCTPTFQQFPPGTLAHSATLKNPQRHDVDRARTLLAQAGYPNGLAITVVVPNGAEPQTSAGQALKAQLAAAGITVNLQPADPATSIADFGLRRFPAYLSAPPGQPHPYTYLQRYYFNLFNLSGPETPALKALGDATLDPTLSKSELAKRWRAVNVLLADKQYDTPVCFLRSFWTFPKDVVGAEDMSFVWAASFDIRSLARLR